MTSGPEKPSTWSRIHPSRRASSIRCRSSTGLVPENSSSLLTPSATVTLPQIFSGAPFLRAPLPSSVTNPHGEEAHGAVSNHEARFRPASFETLAVQAPQDEGVKTGCDAVSLMRSGRVCILPKFKSGNGAVMDLVRPVGEPHRAHRGVVPRQPRIVGDAGCAECLDGVVDD